MIAAPCPTCAYPNPVTRTVCYTCGNLLDPKRQFDIAVRPPSRGTTDAHPRGGTSPP